MTRDRLGRIAALAQGAALVGIGACSNNETLVQAPSAPITAAPSTSDGSDSGDSSPSSDDAGGATPAERMEEGGVPQRWRRHGPPNALPPRFPRRGPPPSGDAGP